MKRWQAFAFLAPLSATAFVGGWWAGLLYGAPVVPASPYRATVILPANTVNCSAAANALVFEPQRITLDCSADRVFVSGFQTAQ